MKPEIKKILMDMISGAGINSCATTEDFTWLFDAVKANAEQLRAYFQTATYNTTGDYKITFSSTDSAPSSPLGSITTAPIPWSE